MTLGEFIKTKCEGRIYDSCVNSPCRWARSGGCTHPDHPKFAPQQRSIEDDWDEPDETNLNLTLKGV